MFRRSEMIRIKRILYHNGKACIHSSAYLQNRYNAEEFIQKSRIPTMHFQPSLPRLPVPKLEETCERYMNAQKPLLAEEEFHRMKSATENFLGHEGRALHAELVEQDKRMKHTSFISAPWFDMYLKYRESVVLNHNPFIMMNDDPNADQLTRATKFIYSAMRFKNSLDSRLMEPDVFHMKPHKTDTKAYRNVMRMFPASLSWYGSYMMYSAFPLDMSQYGHLFNSTRVPRRVKDELQVDATGRHMLIIRNGHLFVFDVVNQDGSLVSRDEIHANLASVMNQSNASADHPVAVLTSESRDTWADTRDHMIKNPTNRNALNKIDSALFCISLDDKPVLDEYEAMRVFLHSDGHSRWFDKSFHIAISSNAGAAINFEHSWGDGVAVVRFLNDICVDSAKDTFQPSSTASKATDVKKLEFELDDSTISKIQTAMETFTERCSKVKISAQRSEHFGRNFLKEKKLGPDSIMQLAFQMAYHRQNGGTAATYESCSTAAFKHGRTETLRSGTVATSECSAAFDDSHPAGVEEMRRMLEECGKVHGQLTKEAAMGAGFDRHLFALRYLAENSGRAVDFFSDPAYVHLNQIILSTSTVTSPHIQMGGFAPVTSNGFGVGYQVADDWLGVNVSSFPDSPNVDEFVELIMKSLNDIGCVINGNNFKN